MPKLNKLITKKRRWSVIVGTAFMRVRWASDHRECVFPDAVKTHQQQ